MAPDIRTLPFGTALTLLRTAPPIITDLRAWTDRPDATTLTTHRGELETLLRAAPTSATPGNDDTA